MSGHPEVAREYIELRNFLAQSNPAPNMNFEVKFEVVGTLLMATNSITNARVEVAKIQPRFYRLFNPHYGLRFEAYSKSLIFYVNQQLDVYPNLRTNEGVIISAIKHKNRLGLEKGYEP